MLQTRVIPCLLLRHGALVKTVKFTDPAYIGDPINAVRIYNELEVDELLFLDIAASVEGTPPPVQVIADIASECFMPVAYGGGVRTLDDAKRILGLGIEKIVINTQAVKDPALVAAAAEHFGNQAVVVSIDARRTRTGRSEVYVRGGRDATGLDPAAHAARMEQIGAGEIMITSIDRDGTMSGYDLELIKHVTNAVHVPVIATGGAGKIDDLRAAVKDAGASAAAAGSLVVYYGRNRAVLINFPDRHELETVLA